jgi:phosphomevalonate kinase
MATAAILKKKQPLKAQLHMAYAIPIRFHKVPSVWQLLGLKKIKMSTVAMVTKVQKMLNSLRTADHFET